MVLLFGNSQPMNFQNFKDIIVRGFTERLSAVPSKTIGWLEVVLTSISNFIRDIFDSSSSINSVARLSNVYNLKLMLSNIILYSFILTITLLFIWFLFSYLSNSLVPIKSDGDTICFLKICIACILFSAIRIASIISILYFFHRIFFSPLYEDDVFFFISIIIIASNYMIRNYINSVSSTSIFLVETLFFFVLFNYYTFSSQKWIS